jgi:hypothetical protein
MQDTSEGIVAQLRFLVECSVALLLFVCSFFLPVFLTNSAEDQRMVGYEVVLDLLWNPMYLILGWPALLPNVTLMAAFVNLLRRRWYDAYRAGLFTLFVAVALSSYGRASNYGSGYYTWVASMFVVTAASAFEGLRTKNCRESNTEVEA